MIRLEQFLELFELSKLLKKRFILINQYGIYGTDEEFSSLSFIYRTDNIDFKGPIAFDKNEMLALLKKGDIWKIEENGSIYNNDGEFIAWIGSGSLIYNNMVSLYINLLNHTNSPLKRVIFTENNISDNKDIMDILNSKVSEGAELYNINNNMYTMFGSMYPITKKDKVDLTLYDLGDNTILSEMKIVKAKATIYAYYRYRSFNI